MPSCSGKPSHQCCPLLLGCRKLRQGEPHNLQYAKEDRRRHVRTFSSAAGPRVTAVTCRQRRPFAQCSQVGPWPSSSRLTRHRASLDEALFYQLYIQQRNVDGASALPTPGELPARPVQPRWSSGRDQLCALRGRWGWALEGDHICKTTHTVMVDLPSCFAAPVCRLAPLSTCDGPPCQVSTGQPVARGDHTSCFIPVPCQGTVHRATLTPGPRAWDAPHSHRPVPPCP